MVITEWTEDHSSQKGLRSSRFPFLSSLRIIGIILLSVLRIIMYNNTGGALRRWWLSAQHQKSSSRGGGVRGESNK